MKCEQNCGRRARVYAIDPHPNGWGGHFCEECAEALRFQVVDRLEDEVEYNPLPIILHLISAFLLVVSFGTIQAGWRYLSIGILVAVSVLIATSCWIVIQDRKDQS